MKRIVFTLLILAGALGLKAQQLPFKPFKTDTANWPKFGDKPKYVVPKSLPLTNLNLLADAQSNIDNMPIARTQGRSNMPVVQTDATGYNMPVYGKSPKSSISGIYYMKRPVADSIVVITPSN